MVNSIDALPEPSLAGGAQTQVGEQVLGPSAHDNSCLGQVEQEGLLKCYEEEGSEARKDKSMVQCNGVKEIVDVAKDLCSMHLLDEPVQKEPHVARQKVERSNSGSEARRKAGMAATKTLIPRERPAQDWSILSVLYQFTSPEFLSGNNMYICNVCNKRNKNTKVTTGMSA